MYLRWQYLGPAWLTREDRGKSRRMADKQPAEGMCRYRLAVVAAHRDATTRKPRVRVVQYLGVVDELALHPSYVGPGVAYKNRNALIEKLGKRLGEAVTLGRVTEDERVWLRGAINVAFPKMQPPEGLSYVAVPARVRAKALPLCERDTRAAWDRMQQAAIEELMVSMARKGAREAATHPAPQVDPAEEKERALLREVRKTMATFGAGAKDAFYRFCDEHAVPPERRDAVWQERTAPPTGA